MSETQTEVDEAITVGLRWERRHLRDLRAGVDLARMVGSPGMASMFDKAVAATECDQPMRVTCKSIDEARQLAAKFGLASAPIPIIEDVRHPGG